MDNTQTLIDEETLIQESTQIDSCADDILKASESLDYSMIDILTQKYPISIISESIFNVTQALCHNIYVIAKDLLSDKINETLDNRILEIFTILFTPPLDDQFTELRNRTKPLFIKLQFSRELAVSIKARTSLKRFNKFLELNVNSATTYSEIKAKHDLASGMLLALSDEATTNEQLTQLYQDAADVFGITALETDISVDQYRQRLVNKLQGIADATLIITITQEMANKNLDDLCDQQLIHQSAEILIPEILSEKDNILPLLIFPEDTPATAKITTPTQPVTIDVG